MIHKTLFASAAIAGAIAMAVPAFAKDPMVGGAGDVCFEEHRRERGPTRRDHTTLVAAVKAAGLVDTLEGAGPFTVFAPTNEAFAKLPAGTVDTLLKPENKAKLAAVLTYHVLPGKVTAAELQAKIKAGGGEAKLKTVEGEDLVARDHDGKIELEGAKGSHAYVTIGNVMQSNGVIHVISGVLLRGLIAGTLSLLSAAGGRA